MDLCKTTNLLVPDIQTIIHLTQTVIIQSTSHMARHCKFTSTISKWTIAGKKRKNFVMEFQWGTYHYFVEGERLDNLKVKKNTEKNRASVFYYPRIVLTRKILARSYFPPKNVMHNLLKVRKRNGQFQSLFYVGLKKLIINGSSVFNFQQISAFKIFLLWFPYMTQCSWYV